MQVFAFKNFDSCSRLRHISQCLPPKLALLEQLLEFVVHLEFRVLHEVVQEDADRRAVHCLPDMHQANIEHLLILVPIRHLQTIKVHFGAVTRGLVE